MCCSVCCSVKEPRIHTPFVRVSDIVCTLVFGRGSHLPQTIPIYTSDKKILGCVYAKTAQTPIFSVKRRSKPRASGGDARWIWLVCRKRPETWINIYICIYICTYRNTAHAHTHTHTHTQTKTHTHTAERGLKHKPSYGSVPYPSVRLSWSELSHLIARTLFQKRPTKIGLFSRRDLSIEEANLSMPPHNGMRIAAYQTLTKTVHKHTNTAHILKHYTHRLTLRCRHSWN